MSGVELAGLVLAVLPLVISALEDYNDGLDPVKAFIKWENYLPQYIRKLRNQHVHYEQTLRLLIAPITTEFELAEMLAEPNGELWKDPDMTHKLKHKLDESYGAYHETVRDIERIMKAIAERLDLDRATSVTRNDLEAMLVANGRPKTAQKFEFRKRVRFTMNRKKIKRLLEELDECNKELERFTEKSEKLEPYRKNSKPSIAQKLQKIQTYARILHHTMVEAFRCSCRTSHFTNLHLEQRRELNSKSVGMRKAACEPGTIFTVTFTDQSSSWLVKEAQICFSEDDQDLSESMNSLHVHPRRSVSFSPTTPPPSPKPLHSPLRTKSVSAHYDEVKDLCAVVKSFDNEEKNCIGLSMDNGKLRGAYPVPLNGFRFSRKAESVTLEDILQDNKNIRLSRKERYTLAVTVASSILQLHASPWISNPWSKRDIMFYRTVSAQRNIDIEHPHVSQKPAPSTTGQMGFSSKNATLLALGILLLELYFGRPCEQNMPANLYMGPDKSLAMLCTAHQWYESEQEDLSAAFQTAIAHCLRCFADPSGSLQDSEFLQTAIDQIVLPLQDELYQFLGTR